MKKQASELIQGKIDSELADIATFEKIKKTLQPFHGLKYDWRLKKKMVAALEAAGFSAVSVGPHHSWEQVKVSAENHPTSSSQGKYRKENDYSFML